MGPAPRAAGMYHGRPALRWLVYVGTLGIVALAPGREQHAPAWLVLGLALLPIGLFELGAGIASEAQSERAIGWGLRFQVAAACAYVGLLVAVLALPTRKPPGAGLMVGLALFGVVASVAVLWDRVRLARGLVPTGIDPLAAGERLAARAGTASAGMRLVDALAVIGGMPILVGLIGLAFVAGAAYVILVRDGKPPMNVVIGIAFFGAVVLVAVTQGLERWETFVSSSRVGRLRAVLQVLSLFAFGGSLAAIGWEMRGDPHEPASKAWLALAGGGLCIAGGVIFAARSLSRPAKNGYELVREGLLERTRRGWFLYPWTALDSIALGEFRAMPALYVRLAADAAVERVDDPSATPVQRERSLERKRRSLRFSRRLFGAEVVVLPTMTAEGVGDLYRAAEGALMEPASRHALPTWRARWMAWQSPG